MRLKNRNFVSKNTKFINPNYSKKRDYFRLLFFMIYMCIFIHSFVYLCKIYEYIQICRAYNQLTIYSAYWLELTKIQNTKT